MIRPPPRSPLFPYTTLSRSDVQMPDTPMDGPGFGPGRPVPPVPPVPPAGPAAKDRKSTRLNSSHPSISYAVFCLKKKKQKTHQDTKYTKQRNSKQRDRATPT